MLPRMVLLTFTCPRSNCLDGSPNYYDWPTWDDPTDYLARAWAPAVKYHAGFKWIWLNQPASNKTLTIETVFDVKFADELYAESRTGRDPQP